MFYHFQENVFSKEFCDKILAKSKKLELKNDTLNTEEKNVKKLRHNTRFLFSDVNLAEEIEKVILDKLGDKFPHSYKNKSYVQTGQSFRLYKYELDQCFKTHRDAYKTVFNRTSLCTVLIYLNDADSGETILMPNGFGNKDNWIYVKPKMGSVLVFDQSLYHEGLPVLSGQKHVLRTDLYFS